MDSCIIPSTPIDPEYVKWLEVRQYILDTALEYVPRRKLLLQCTWPDAVWLASLWQDRDIILDVLQRNIDDVRALALFSILMRDYDGIERAAKMGNSLAQYQMCLRPDIDDSMVYYWAKLSAMQDEPIGLIHLGICYNFAMGTTKNSKIANRCYLRAYKLGNPDASLSIAWTYEKTEPEHYLWLYRSSKSEKYRHLFPEWVNAEAPTMNNACIYQVGRLIHGSQNHRSIKYSRIIVARYLESNNTTRSIIKRWILVARRSGVCRDVQRLITALIWDSRKEGC